MVFCFLPKLRCSYQSYFISYQDFAILIDIVLYHTEHLGKIDQSLQTGLFGIPSSKVWHRCRSKPPNCRLARAARVVCAHPGTIVCSQTPLSLVVCKSGGEGGVYVGIGWFKSTCIDIKAWLDHHSLLLVAQIKLTLDVDPQRDDDASPMSTYRCMLRPTWMISALQHKSKYKSNSI